MVCLWLLFVLFMFIPSASECDNLHSCDNIDPPFYLSGRRITPSGRRDLDQVAGRIVVAP